MQFFEISRPLLVIKIDAKNKQHRDEIWREMEMEMITFEKH